MVVVNPLPYDHDYDGPLRCPENINKVFVLHYILRKVNKMKQSGAPPSMHLLFSIANNLKLTD